MFSLGNSLNVGWIWPEFNHSGFFYKVKMYKFGTNSSKKLATCHPILFGIAARALELSPYDFTIVHGWRGEDVQNALFDSGASQKRWPNSKHNATTDAGRPLSEAIDFGPWVSGKIPWNDIMIFGVIAGCFFAAAAEKNAAITWGGDWDTDGSTKDQTLLDFGHIQIILSPAIEDTANG